jgi:hypothetical protein
MLSACSRDMSDNKTTAGEQGEIKTLKSLGDLTAEELRETGKELKELMSKTPGNQIGEKGFVMGRGDLKSVSPAAGV